MNELIRAMESRGYTTKGLALKLGVTVSYLSLLRNGHRNPSPDLIRKIKAEFPELATMADVVHLNLVK